MMPLPGVLSSILFMIMWYGILTDHNAAQQTFVNLLHALEGYAQYPDGNITDKWFNEVCANVSGDVAKLSVNPPWALPDYCPIQSHWYSQSFRKFMASFQPVFDSLVDRWVMPGPKVNHSAAVVFDGFVHFAPSQSIAIVFSYTSTLVPGSPLSISYNHSHLTVLYPEVNETLHFHPKPLDVGSLVANIFCSWPMYKQFLARYTVRYSNASHRLMNNHFQSAYLKCSHPVERYDNSLENTFLHAASSLASLYLGKNSELYIPCWNERLRWAANLLQKQGPWHVTRHCITTVQHLTVKMLRDFSPQIFKYLFPRIESKVFTRILEDLEPVYWKSFSIFQQLFVFPPFKRFVSIAEDRGGKSTVDRSRAVVSCRGLEGTVSSARSTIVRILYLVMVNDIKHTSSPAYAALKYMAYDLFSYVPGCYVDQTLL